MELELQEYVRKPFPVKGVEITFKNADQVAKWCGGRVEIETARVLGGTGKAKIELPTVVFKGTGDNRDREFTAALGDFIVELRGNFRVFKKAQFRATFEPKPEPKQEDETCDCGGSPELHERLGLGSGKTVEEATFSTTTKQDEAIDFEQGNPPA